MKAESIYMYTVLCTTRLEQS